MLGVEERGIQRGGRVTIPKSLREKYGLEEGTIIKFRSKGDKREIEPPTRLSRLIGLIKTDQPSDDPKAEARRYTKDRLWDELE